MFLNEFDTLNTNINVFSSQIITFQDIYKHFRDAIFPDVYPSSVYQFCLLLPASLIIILDPGSQPLPIEVPAHAHNSITRGELVSDSENEDSLTCHNFKIPFNCYILYLLRNCNDIHNQECINLGNRNIKFNSMTSE